MKKTLLSITIILVVASSLLLTYGLSKDQNTKSKLDKKTIKVISNSKFNKPLINSVDTNLVRINLDSLGIINELKYATQDNFLNQKIYPCAECYLRGEVAKSLMKINAEAKSLGYKLVFFDCYRPYSAQVKMFSIIPDDRYVADPKKGASNHNRGIALDISLASPEGTLLEMGSEFDEFSEKSHFSYSKISKTARNNRNLLKNLMINGGFEPYENEWWHFSYHNKKYKTSDFSWPCN